MNQFVNSVKWQLLLRVLPLTLLFGITKGTIHYFNLEPWQFDSLTGSLFGAVTFVIAFLLSGTISEYNASGGMPIQLVNACESIEDSNQLTALDNSDYNPIPLTQGLITILQNTLHWLKNEQSYEEIEDSLTTLNELFAEFKKFALAPLVNRVQTEQSKIRLLITQMKINRDTDYLKPAYALLEIFLVGAVVTLLLIRADSFGESLFASCFLFTSFCYLIFLIRDLDNPFQYDGKSCVDVNLSPLETLCQRLKNKVKDLN